jgi:phosphatidylserine/phosphatidylglycerophosphate/cardiolipin synthase-like enzyme
MPATAIRAHANCDDAYVVWRYDEPIPECRGFALYRRPHGGDPEPVRTFVPFAGRPHRPGESQPSTVWPVQRFSWTDVLARNGDVVSYRVVPMVGTAGALHEAGDLASDWTDELSVGPRAGDDLWAYFNRGVLATQAIARRLGADQPWKSRLREMIGKVGDPTREYLSGELRIALMGVLHDVAAAPDAVVHAALFELDDPELLAALCALGPRAHVVLANGDEPKADENVDARGALRAAGVQVHDRMTGSRLAHNKFLVVSRPADAPQRVWTGSTNWTQTGLCTQVNNAILIENAEAAAYYKAHWDALVAAGDAFPADMVAADSRRRTATLDRGSIGTWFAPTHAFVDLDDARALIAAARDGILFLMFNPGRRDTLFNAIMDRADPQSPHHDPDLYVHGVLNQDPEAGSDDQALIGLIQRGRLDEADPDVVLPGKIDARFASWDAEVSRYTLVMVHSKVIVLDPFGDRPVVMTGSHNLGPRASSRNDDNLNIISGVPALAAAYATNIRAIYDNFRWRYVRSQRAKDAGHDWQGPEDGAAWQDGYFTGPDAAAKQRELRFWLGEG